MDDEDARAREDQRHGVGAARAAGDRGRSAAEPRAHPAREARRDRVDGGEGPRPRGADPRHPEAAVRSRRRRRRRVVLPREGSRRAGDVAQQPARVAGVFGVARRRAARRAAPPLDRRREAARVDPVDRAPVRRRADVLRHAPAQRDRRLDARAVGHDAACARCSTWTRSSASSRPSRTRRRRRRC